jgi:hypothetical protein
MKANYYGLVMVEPHIKAYWLKRHGIEKPLNTDPKNEFLKRFIQQIADIIKLVEASQAEGLSSEDLSEIHQNLFESLRDFQGELDRIGLEHFADKDFNHVINMLKKDVDGARLHLKYVLDKKKEKPENFMVNFAHFMGATVLENTSQEEDPFFGSEGDKEDNIALNEGICCGKVMSWGNHKPYNIFETFKNQERNSSTRTGLHNFVPTREVSSLFENNIDLSTPRNYGVIILASPKSSNAHDIGIRQCAGSNEYEVYDPNFCKVKLKNKNDAILFIKFLIAYYSDNDEASFDFVRLNRQRALNVEQASDRETLTKINNEKSEDELLAVIEPELIKGISIAAARAFKKMSTFENVKQEEDKIILYINFLKEHKRAPKAVDLIKTLMTKKYFCMIEFACYTSLEAIAESINQSKNETEIFSRLFQSLTGSENESDNQQFEKIPNKEQKYLVLKCMIKYKLPFDTLLTILTKFKDYPDVLRLIDSNLFSRKMLENLSTCDLPLMIQLSKILYNTESLELNANKLYVLIVMMNQKDLHPDNRHFNDVEFLETMSSVISEGKVVSSDQVFNMTSLMFDIATAKRMLSNKHQWPAGTASFLSACQNIIDNPLSNEAQRDEWSYMKRFFESNSLIQNEQDIQLLLKHIDLFITVSLLQPKKDVIDAIHQYLMSNLSNIENCRYLYMMHENLKLTVDPQVLCQHLTLENKHFIIPILTSKDVLNSMTNEQFTMMIEKILSLHPEKGLLILNDTLLSPQVISQLSFSQVLTLAKYLIKKCEEDPNFAQAYQYDEQASIGEKCKERTIFPSAITNLVSGMSTNKTRWTQITEDLYKRADYCIYMMESYEDMSAAKEDMEVLTKMKAIPNSLQSKPY